jgi:hypothetical protein
MSAFFLASKDRNADSRFVHAPDGVGTAFRALIQEGNLLRNPTNAGVWKI